MEASKDRANGNKKSIKLLGPWGGNGGNNWDDGTYNGVREIRLGYGQSIDWIQVVYDKNGEPVTAEKQGGGGPYGGTHIAEIKLQYPEEILVSLSGHYSRPPKEVDNPVIRSLTFKSNRRTYGPFGVTEGTSFTFSMDGGLIVGFHGRSGWCLDALGIRLSRVQTEKLFPRVLKSLQRLTCCLETASKASVPRDSEKTS